MHHSQKTEGRNYEKKKRMTEEAKFQLEDKKEVASNAETNGHQMCARNVPDNINSTRWNSFKVWINGNSLKVLKLLENTII